MLQYLATIRKALTAAAMTGASAIAIANTDNVITDSEWGGIIVAASFAGLSVWVMPNAPKKENTK